MLDLEPIKQALRNVPDEVMGIGEIEQEIDIYQMCTCRGSADYRGIKEHCFTG